MIGMIRNMSHVDNEKTLFCALYTCVYLARMSDVVALVAVGVVRRTVALFVFKARCTFLYECVVRIIVYLCQQYCFSEPASALTQARCC